MNDYPEKAMAWHKLRALRYALLRHRQQLDLQERRTKTTLKELLQHRKSMRDRGIEEPDD